MYLHQCMIETIRKKLTFCWAENDGGPISLFIAALVDNV